MNEIGSFSIRRDRTRGQWQLAFGAARSISCLPLAVIVRPSSTEREVAKAQRAKLLGSGGGACGSAAAAAAAQSSVEWADALSARGLSPPRRAIARAQAARLGVAPPATERDDAPSGS